MREGACPFSSHDFVPLLPKPSRKPLPSIISHEFPGAGGENRGGSGERERGEGPPLFFTGVVFGTLHRAARLKDAYSPSPREEGLLFVWLSLLSYFFFIVNPAFFLFLHRFFNLF